MADNMAAVNISTLDVLRYVKIRSTTKDSIMIAWQAKDKFTSNVYGYTIRYQAIGSAVEQQTHLKPSASAYDIRHLHENTYYDVCVRAITNLTARGASFESCITSNTAGSSLSVALGSTFGAFLALGVIVLFVLIAKWQHVRKYGKPHPQKLSYSNRLTSSSGHSLQEETMVRQNGDIELRTFEDFRDELNQQSKDQPSPGGSEFSADIILHGAGFQPVTGTGGGKMSEDEAAALRLVLDNAGCADSYIVSSPSNDGDPTKQSYGLLVPLSAPGVIPYLVGQSERFGSSDHCSKPTISSRHYPVPRSAQCGNAHIKPKCPASVLRLKLKKHMTVDYGSGEGPYTGEEWSNNMNGATGPEHDGEGMHANVDPSMGDQRDDQGGQRNECAKNGDGHKYMQRFTPDDVPLLIRSLSSVW